MGAAIVASVIGLVLMASPADAQLFFATRPNPGFMVGPLFVQATVHPDRQDVPVEILLSLVIPPTRSALDFEQDIYLLWPGGVSTQPPSGSPDRALVRAVETQGLMVLSSGHLPMVAQRHYEPTAEGEPIAGGAPYVTFVRSGGPLGLSAPATYIRIPWTPRLVNPAWLINVSLTTDDLLRPKPTTWVGRMISGPRQLLSLGFGDVGAPAMFAMYFGQRDRVLPVSAPSRLLVNFTHADRLGIADIAPPSSRRELSQSRDNTALVSLFLSTTAGLSPQALRVEFGYFSRLQSWGPVVIPALFFALGNVAGAFIRVFAEALRKRLAGRFQVGRRWITRPDREQGAVLSREVLAQIVPGQTTYDGVIRLCGQPSEEREDLATADRRTLIYRGRRDVPQRRWTLGWLATVSHWDVEHHEVEIAIDRGVVRDTQVSIRRSRLSTPDAA